jgi:hypothetical protein
LGKSCGELRQQAEASTIVAQLRGLVEWAGRDGRAVTAAGRLRMADARELVDVLGTDDKVEGVRSSADLPRLGLLVEWAKKARLVRAAKGRLYAVAKARPVLAPGISCFRRSWNSGRSDTCSLSSQCVGRGFAPCCQRAVIRL